MSDPKTICASCGLPGHRYGRNEGPDRYYPMACINSLRGRIENAPTVWWCAFQEARSPIPCTQLKPEYLASENHDDCRWVALVPVSGGEG